MTASTPVPTTLRALPAATTTTTLPPSTTLSWIAAGTWVVALDRECLGTVRELDEGWAWELGTKRGVEDSLDEAVLQVVRDAAAGASFRAWCRSVEPKTGTWGGR